MTTAGLTAVLAERGASRIFGRNFDARRKIDGCFRLFFFRLARILRYKGGLIGG
jgi:hypothetical protein